MTVQASARKIRILEVSSGMIAAGVEECARLSLAISAEEAPDIVANLWSVVEAKRRLEIVSTTQAHHQHD